MMPKQGESCADNAWTACADGWWGVVGGRRPPSADGHLRRPATEAGDRGQAIGGRPPEAITGTGGGRRHRKPSPAPEAEAIERYAAGEARLDADCQARLAALNRQLATGLRAAIRQAIRNGYLANAQALQEHLDKLVGRAYALQIDAAKDWQPTIEAKNG